MIILTATKNNLVARPTELITSGSVNVYPVQFRFSLDWDGLVRTAIFRAGGTAISVLLDDTNECAIPWEVLVKPGQRLEAGVYGTRDGAVVLPTIWAGLGQIREGAEPGENAQPPTPDILDQALEKAVGYVGQAQSFAAQAKSDADRAAQIAADMAVIAKQVSLDAATASKAKEDAQTAQTAAKTAQAAAETAKQAAEDAAKTTEDNATAAATAAERAEDAANAASAALAELQTLYQAMQTYAAQAIQAIQTEGKTQLEQIETESTQAQLDIANEKTDALIAVGDATDKSIQAVQAEGETQTANAKAQADRAAAEADEAKNAQAAAEAALAEAEALVYLTDARENKTVGMAWGINADGYPTLTLTEKEDTTE